MISQQIQQLSKVCDLITLQNYINENEIKQLIQNKKFNEVIHIECNLEYQNIVLLKDLFNQMSELIFLKISYISSILAQLVTSLPLANLGESLIPQKKLNYLIINVNYYEEIKNKDEFAKSFSQGLSELQNLIFLKLNLGNITQLSVEGAQSISKSLQGLNQLIQISYEIHFCKQEDLTGQIQVFKQLCNGKKQQKCLEELKLLFIMELNMNDEQLIEISNILKQQDHLNQLELKFSRRTILTDFGILQLTDSLKKLKKLQKFYVYLEEKNQVHNIFNVSEGITEIENIEILSLNINMNVQFSEQYIFGKQIKQNSNLKKLRICIIIKSTISTSELIFHDNTLNLTNLIELDIILCQINLNEHSQETFLKLLSRNSNLRTLYFYITSEINSQFNNQLKTQLSLLKQLQILHVFVRNETSYQLQFKNFTLRKNKRLVIQIYNSRLNLYNKVHNYLQ